MTTTPPDYRAEIRAALLTFVPAALPEPTPVVASFWQLSPVVRWWLARPSDPWAASFYTAVVR